jgi:glycosyltransferase involved in cell wall biosynthesis
VKMRIIGPFMDKWYDRNGRYEVNVIEMSADGVPGALQELGWKAYHSYNILRTYWELARAPSEWGAWLMGIDEIWVPNKFVGDAFRFIFDGRITIVPPCVDIKSEINYEREAYDMDLGIFYFLFSFEYFSFPARKNPFGVLRAFRAAFPDQDERVGLVIKSTGGGGHPEVRAALLEAARQDRRIKIIDRTLSRDEILSLIGQSDCYVSLHRAEGFGLGMAEAMAFGIPVIGTNYSGNTEFLSDTTGFTVSYTLRAVRPGEYLFAEDQVWAEPDETAAAQVMRKVFDDPRERQSRAAAGKAFVEARYSRKTAGKIAERRLKEILAMRLRK